MERYEEEVRRTLRLLRAHRTHGFEKARMGNMNDGGYVCLDDFAGIDVGFSFGINDDITWDVAAVEHGLTVYQFDHTVEQPSEDPRMIFEKKMISGRPREGCVTLSELIARHDKGRQKPNIFLKTDIEASEWGMINNTPPEQLSRIAQIVGEFHYFEGLADPVWRDRIGRAVKRLSNHFVVVHVHANNFAEVTNHGGVFVPNVLELCLVNREVYRSSPSDELFPGPLDQPCYPGLPDIWLGAFRF